MTNPEPSTVNSFLGSLAAVALEGLPEAAARPAGEAAVPLALHARAFLKNLPTLEGADAVALALVLFAQIDERDVRLADEPEPLLDGDRPAPPRDLASDRCSKAWSTAGCPATR